MSSTIQRLPIVKQRTGLCRTSIYDGVKRRTFPAPVRLGLRAVGWLESDITAWIESRPTASGVAAAPVKYTKGVKTAPSGADHDGQRDAEPRRALGVGA